MVFVLFNPFSGTPMFVCIVSLHVLDMTDPRLMNRHRCRNGLTPYPYTGWTMFGRRYSYNTDGNMCQAGPQQYVDNYPAYYDTSATNGKRHNPLQPC